MSGRASKSEIAGVELDVEADENHQDEIDAFIARNREALIESISNSEADFKAGIRSKVTMRDIIEAGRKRHGG